MAGSLHPGGLSRQNAVDLTGFNARSHEEQIVNSKTPDDSRLIDEEMQLGAIE